jgi:hypothetical protein
MGGLVSVGWTRAPGIGSIACADRHAQPLSLSIVEGPIVLTRRRRTPSAALLIALVGACALASPAGAATKPYSVVILPSNPVPAGASVPFQATITNLARSQTLGSANLTAPGGFSVTGASVGGLRLPLCSGPSSFSCVFGNLVQLRNLGVAFGKSVTVTVTANVPNACAPDGCTWTVAAKQSNDFNGTGNDFGPLDASSSLTTPPTSDGLATVCPGGCLATLNDTDASISVNVPRGNTGLVTISRGEPAIDCAGYDELLASDFIVDYLPDQGTTAVGIKTVSLIISKDLMNQLPANGASLLNMCFAAPFQFTIKPGSLPSPDQFGLHVGLLPDCSATFPPPCVSKRNKTQAGQGVIEAQTPNTAQDPRIKG